MNPLFARHAISKSARGYIVKTRKSSGLEKLYAPSSALIRGSDVNNDCFQSQKMSHLDDFFWTMAKIVCTCFVEYFLVGLFTMLHKVT